MLLVLGSLLEENGFGFEIVAFIRKLIKMLDLNLAILEIRKYQEFRNLIPEEKNRSTKMECQLVISIKMTSLEYFVK